MVKASKVYILQTSLTLSISNILKSEGFIDNFERDVFIEKIPFICLTLKFKGLKKEPYITDIKRISKPGLRVYTKSFNIPRVLGGIGTTVFVLCLILILFLIAN